MANEKKNTRVYIDIDGENTLVTNALMMDYAIKALEETNAPSEIVAKAKTHLATISAKSSGPRKPSAAAVENAAYAMEALKVMPTDEPVTTSWLMEHVKVNGIGITKVNKMAQVMKLLVDTNKVTKDTSGRKVTYTKPA